MPTSLYTQTFERQFNAMSAKQKRTSTKGMFTRAENSLIKLLRNHGDDDDKQDANNYVSDVERAWRNVEVKHEEYMASLAEDVDTAKENEWIMDIQERYYDIRKGYVKFKSDFDLRVKVNSLKKARSVEYETFLNFYMNLETSMKNGHPIETISHEKNSLAHQFE